MKKKSMLFILLLNISLLIGCQKNNTVLDSNGSIQNVQDESAKQSKSDSKQVIQNESTKQSKEEVSIIGGDNIINDNETIELGGILGAIDQEDAELMKDSLDEEEIVNMTNKEKSELIGNMDILIDQHESVMVVVKEKLKENSVNVDVDEKTGKITMDNSILFDVGQYELSEKGKEYLDDFFKAYAEAILDENIENFVSEIQIIGNASSDGDYEENKELSEKRAMAVKEFCLNSENNGLDMSQKKKLENMMNAFGVSSDNPIIGEDGKEDVEASRRVEFKFMMNLE